jgi:hypothetical protein
LALPFFLYQPQELEGNNTTYYKALITFQALPYFPDTERNVVRVVCNRKEEGKSSPCKLTVKRQASGAAACWAQHVHDVNGISEAFFQFWISLQDIEIADADGLTYASHDYVNGARVDNKDTVTWTLAQEVSTSTTQHLRVKYFLFGMHTLLPSLLQLL